ncbi:MAG: class I adenylate-forming enzyme family protein [Myxococcota bacterium]
MPAPFKTFVTLAEVADHHAEARPGRIALTDGDLELTWDEVRTRTRRLAARLLGLGISHGDRVAVLSHNRPEIIEVQLACARIGAIFTPINTRLSTSELTDVVELVEPGVIFHDGTHTKQVDRLCKGLRRIDFDGDSSFGYASLVELPTSIERPGHVGADDPAVMIFTSGTTGTPLGAVLTHGQIAANHRQFLQGLPITEDTVNYAVAPLFHVAGLNTITGPTLVAGGTSVFTKRFDAGQVLADVGRFDVTTTFMVPTMWHDLVAHPDFAAGALDRLEFGLVGGARCPRSVEQSLADRNIPVYEGYGMTEAGPMVTLRAPGPDTSAPRSVGPPGPDVELRVVDRASNVIRDREVGELQVRAPNVMSGYWRDEAATKDALRDGWLSTGDLGFLADGSFHLLDRVDDMINSGAEKIYPSEIEHLVATHPSVRDVAVIGTPHPRWGEAVTAVVVPEDDRPMPDLQSLRDHLSDEIARYKLPRRLELVASLPRNGAGKLQRREVRSMLVPERPAAS